MVVTSISDIAAALPAGLLIPIVKNSISNMATGKWASLWKATGTPTAGATPGAAAIPTKATTGSLWNFTNAAGGDEVYLALMSLNVTNAATTIDVVDRLAHMGGLSGTTTGAQTVSVDVNSLKGTRCANDLSDVRWWIEVYTDVGTTGQTVTVTYTRDSDGTTGRTTTATQGGTLTLGGASPANRASSIYEILPIAGETIRSIQSVSISTTTGTAGSWGVTATKHITQLHFEAPSTGKTYDWSQLALPKVNNDACLALHMLCGAATTGQVQGLGKLITT